MQLQIVATALLGIAEGGVGFVELLKLAQGCVGGQIRGVGMVALAQLPEREPDILDRCCRLNLENVIEGFG
jgi:hypothetical protein